MVSKGEICGYLTRAASRSHRVKYRLTELYFSDALGVTARGSYELCCQSIFDSVTA